MAEASAATTIDEMPIVLVYSSGGACLRHVDLATALCNECYSIANH